MARRDEMRYELMSMNELRTILYEMGIEYPENASKQQLINLIRQHT